MPRGERMLPTTVVFRRDQVDALRALSAATKVPAAEFIRQAVDAFLLQQRPAPPSPSPRMPLGEAPACLKCGGSGWVVAIGGPGWEPGKSKLCPDCNGTGRAPATMSSPAPTEDK